MGAVNLRIEARGVEEIKGREKRTRRSGARGATGGEVFEKPPRSAGGPGCVDLESAGDTDAISGELALWGAVLLQAIEDYRRKGAGYEVSVNGIRLRGWYYDREIRSDKRRAEAWFKSQSEDMGSYLWICDLLQLDPERVWARIREKDFALTV
ncbi:MAG: hypothetical protein P4L43_19350 [Syntrophobacteraceae bacterium]|nr:hypothetical protein [Syntrophobacteraceae bacterium]